MMIIALLDWRTAKNDIENGQINDWGGLMPWSCIKHSQGTKCHDWWNVILLLLTQFSSNIEVIILEPSRMAKSRRYFDDRIASRWNYNADLEYFRIVSIYLLFNLKYLHLISKTIVQLFDLSCACCCKKYLIHPLALMAFIITVLLLIVIIIYAANAKHDIKDTDTQVI